MDPQMLQALLQMLTQQQQAQPQIPNAQVGMPQIPKPQMPQAVSAQATPPPPPPSAAGQAAQNVGGAAATAGATVVNPLLGMLMQAIMPSILQALFGQRKQKQQMPSAQVMPYPR